MRWGSLLGAVLLVVACGRIDFTPHIDAGAITDTLAVNCDWSGAGGPRLGTVMARPELQTPLIESDLQLVRGDPLTIYFSRDSGGGRFDVFTAHRPTVMDYFDPPVLVPELATSNAAEYGPEVDASGHGYMAYSSTIAGVAGLWEIQRTTGVFTRIRELTEVADGLSQLDPFVTDDGLTLWFSSFRTGLQQIFYATRSTPSGTFGAATQWANNLPGLGNASASLTADQRVIVWTVGDTMGSSDIYYATRASPQDAFGPPALLGPGVVSTTDLELEPSVRDDGCELFFDGATPGSGFRNWDPYSVTIE